MADASPITADAQTASQDRSARGRFRVLLVIVGTYFFIAFAAPILIDDAGILLLKPYGWWRNVDRYWLMGCAILIAGWVALGPGWMTIRAPQGLIAIGWLLLAWLLGLTMSPNVQPELELAPLGCAAVVIATLVVLLVVRRCSGRTIARADGVSEMGARRFQYSLTTLLLIMLLVGVTLTLIGWIDPRYRNYFADTNLRVRWYPGVNRWRMLERIWCEALGAILIAAACLPVFLSFRKRSFVWALGLFAVALAVRVLIDEFARTYVLYPLIEGKPIDWNFMDYHVVNHFVNLSTLDVCLLTAAAAMHCLGYRLSAERAGKCG